MIAALTAADADGDGELDFHEFVNMISQGRTAMSGEIQGQLSEMREIFSIFDPNGDGAISADEIHPVLTHYCGLDESSFQVQLCDIERLLLEVDDDGNGELDFFEFASMMAISALPHQPKLRDKKPQALAEQNEPPPFLDEAFARDLLTLPLEVGGCADSERLGGSVEASPSFDRLLRRR